jgi:hypothetical protein
VEIQGWQLIDDDADRYILALTGIDTCDKTVQDKGIEAPMILSISGSLAISR